MSSSVAPLMPEEASLLLSVYPYSSFNYCFCIVLKILKIYGFFEERKGALAGVA